MIYIKNKQAINKMRTAGRLLAQIMRAIECEITPGVSTLKLDDRIEKWMLEKGLRPECKGYKGYKHATCISVNDVVVHGVPSEDVILKEGDLLKIDAVGSYKGYCADMARCFFVGAAGQTAQRLARVARSALDTAIKQAVVGSTVSHISESIQRVVEREGFGVVRDFSGHGIGKRMHEEPEVPNFATGGSGPTLRHGMVLAIEPMITEKGHEVFVEKDGWTAKTVDGGLAGHVEDTVLITDNGPEVLTWLES